MSDRYLFQFKNRVSILFDCPPSTLINVVSEEFSPDLLAESDHTDIDAIIVFNDSHTLQNSDSIHKRPIGFNATGPFFIDQHDHICRIQFSISTNSPWNISVDPRFDSHFFYIIILYILVVRGVKYSYFYIHASFVSFAGKTYLFPAWRHVGKTLVSLRLEEHGGRILSDDGVFIDSHNAASCVSRMSHFLSYNMTHAPRLLGTLSTKQRNIYSLYQQVLSDPYSSPQFKQHIASLVRFRVPILDIHSARSFHAVSSVIFLDKYNTSSRASYFREDRTGLQSLIATSSKFEIRYLFSLYDVYVSMTGFSDPLMESYDTIFSELLSHFLHSVPNHLTLHPNNVDSTLLT